MRLIAKNLASFRSGRQVFAGLGFELAGGEALAITGPNGAGKSSLLRIVAGLLPSSAGTLDLEGGDPEVSIAEQAHYLGHRDALKSPLTLHETLTFWQAMLGQAAFHPMAALERVGLIHAADLPSGYLSAGQRRRLALARLLVSYRPLWLLDEPTSALDKESEAMFSGLVSEHCAKGGLVLVATHMPLGFASREFRLGGAS
jgi:heme exporter protein A